MKMGYVSDLNKIVKDAKAFRIRTGLNVDERPDLGSCEGNVLVPHDNLELLASHPIGFRPVVVVLLHDLALRDYSAALTQNGGSEVHLLADYCVVFVVGVVGVTELAVGSELKFKKLVAELPLVPHVVSQVELPLLLFAPHFSDHKLQLFLLLLLFALLSLLCYAMLCFPSTTD